jgi:hypothetical protein
MCVGIRETRRIIDSAKRHCYTTTLPDLAKTRRLSLAAPLERSTVISWDFSRYGLRFGWPQPSSQNFREQLNLFAPSSLVQSSDFFL